MKKVITFYLMLNEKIHTMLEKKKDKKKECRKKYFNRFLNLTNHRNMIPSRVVHFYLKNSFEYSIVTHDFLVCIVQPVQLCMYT